MIDSDTMACPQQQSAGCLFSTIGRICQGQKQNGRQIFQVEYDFSTN